MENSTLVTLNCALLTWCPDVYICICIWVALFFALKHLIGRILLLSLRASTLENATECIASSLHIQEKRASPDEHIQYDVFISYQNNEISANRFVDNLYEVLKSCGVRAFVKSKEAEEEEVVVVLDGRTKHAISTAKLHLAIFSKEYAQSPKCLSELYEMVKNDKRVFPLFFDIEPSDARWIRRSYAEAFKRHGEQQKFQTETLNNWKEALHAVSLITGWELAQFKGCEFLLPLFLSKTMPGPSNTSNTQHNSIRMVCISQKRIGYGTVSL